MLKKELDDKLEKGLLDQDLLLSLFIGHNELEIFNTPGLGKYY